MAEGKIEVRISAADAINAVEGMVDLMTAATVVVQQYQVGDVSRQSMVNLSAALSVLNGKESKI